MTFLHSFPSRLLLLTVAWGLFALSGSALAAESARADGLKEAQAAFNKKQYDQALQLLESLGKGGKVTADVRRLKIRTLVKLGTARRP